MRNRVGIIGSALVLCLAGCTGHELAGRQPLNSDPVTDLGPEICSLLPKSAIAHITARAEENLTSVGELPVGPGVDRGQCEVIVSDSTTRQTVASLRIDADQQSVVVRVNNALQAAKERNARLPLPNPLTTGTDSTPIISLAVKCGNRPVLIGIDISGYDVRRKTADRDLADLTGIVAAKYGDRLGCRPTVSPPLSEQQRGTVRMMAGNGSLDIPSGPVIGPSTGIGYVEALTTADDGSVYFVGRKYPADMNPRNADDNTSLWGQTLRVLHLRTDGLVDVAWDPNLAPFSTNNDPVAGDIPEKLRLQGRNTLGSVTAIALHNDQVWLIPASPSFRQPAGALSRPVRVIQLNGARAVDLRAIKAQVDGTRIKDQNGQAAANGMDVWNAARFAAVSVDGDTPVLLDVAQGRIWRIDGLRDGKVLDATVFPIGAQLASGGSVAGLSDGRFAASTPQGGLVVLDGRGRVTVSVPAVSAEIDGVGPSPLESGRRQLAAAGDDVLIHAMCTQVATPAVVRVDGRTGAGRTLQVSGYPGPRDPVSDVETTRFAKVYGTAASATSLFATGWPVSAFGAVGQNLILAPFGTRILYELSPRR